MKALARPSSIAASSTSIINAPASTNQYGTGQVTSVPPGRGELVGLVVARVIERLVRRDHEQHRGVGDVVAASDASSARRRRRARSLHACRSSVTTTMLPPWLKPPDGARRITLTTRSICSVGSGSGRNARCIRRRPRISRNSTVDTVYRRQHDQIPGEDSTGDRRREGHRRRDGEAARGGRCDGGGRRLRRGGRGGNGAGGRRPRRPLRRHEARGRGGCGRGRRWRSARSTSS